MAEQEGHAYLKTHQLSGEVMHLDLEAERKAVLDAARSAGVGHSAKTLVKDGPLRVVLVGLTAGSQLREHKTEGPVLIEALQGAAMISSGDATERLAPGSMLVFGAGIPHSVDASEDSVLALTIAVDGGN